MWSLDGPAISLSRDALGLSENHIRNFKGSVKRKGKLFFFFYFSTSLPPDSKLGYSGS